MNIKPLYSLNVAMKYKRTCLYNFWKLFSVEAAA